MWQNYQISKGIFDALPSPGGGVGQPLSIAVNMLIEGFCTAYKYNFR